MAAKTVLGMAVAMAFGALPGAALAQGARGQNAPAAAPAAQAPAATAPKAPEVTKTEQSRIDNWILSCADFADPARKKLCSAKYQIIQKDSNNVLFVWELGFNQERKMLSVVQTPTGVLIGPGVEFKIGSGASRKAVFESCEPSRCIAVLPIDEKLIKDVSASPRFDVVLTAVNGAKVTFQIEANGVDKVYSSLTR